LLANGARVVPVRVDGDGLRVEDLPTGADAPLLACVTPSHQYPLGARMPIARRLALLDWARTNDSLIVEDDYDSEFRFDAPPLPALMSLDGERGEGRVAYIGTFAKCLAPTLRLGYLIAPPALRARIVALKSLTDRHTSWPIQRVVLALIAEGHLERHIRRARRRYAEDRAILRAGLLPVTTGPDAPARLRGLEAGLHVCLEFAPGIDAMRVALAARRRGVAVATLDEYYHGPPDRQGLILGYGGLAPDELARGTRILAGVIAECGVRSAE
jgi:GntR family transcriptional regulator/MocR family aminotransferase